MKTFAEKLTEYIKSKNITKEEFADLIGVSRQTVINASTKSNPRKPSLDLLMKIVTYEKDFDLNYYLKDWMDTPTKLTRIDPYNITNEDKSTYNDKTFQLLTEIKEQNTIILSKIS